MSLREQVTNDEDHEMRWDAFRTLWRGEATRGRSGRTRSLATSVAVVLWLLALFLVFLTWNGLAERADVALQLPYLVSGALSALLLTLIGSAVLLWGVLAESAETPGGGFDEDRSEVTLDLRDGRKAQG